MRFLTTARLCVAVLALFGSAAASAELAIIGHPSNPIAGMSKDEVARIYLDKTSRFPDGGHATPVDQPEDSAVRAKFDREVLGMDAGELKRYWSKRMFTGKGKPPQQLGNGGAVKQWVATHPDGLGYVEGSQVDDSVKVLLILP